MLNNFVEGIKSLSRSALVMENANAMKNEILRKCGVGVCNILSSRVASFMPDSWKIKIFLATPTGKNVMTVLLSQFVGNTLYVFRDGLSPENQRYMDMLRQSAWMASATALTDMANIDKLFDMLVPDSAKLMLDKHMKEIQRLEAKMSPEEQG